MTMNNVRSPSQFFDSLKHSAGKEYHALVIILKLNPCIVCYNGLAREEIIIVDKVYLDSCRRDRGNLDNELMVIIVDNKVHTR